MKIPEILIAFDTDGIFKALPYYSKEDLEWFDNAYIAGPIDPLLVKNELKPIADIYIVSESPFYPKEPDGTPMFPVLNSLPSRYLNIIECYNSYWDKYQQEPKVKLYVSDNGDYAEAQKAEFRYIRHDIFYRTMKETGII